MSVTQPDLAFICGFKAYGVETGVGGGAVHYFLLRLRAIALKVLARALRRGVQVALVIGVQ